ncbi:MAG: hypothetical protein PHW62_00725 [Candidatus Ratteibacteria bacterium]|nr:hypothetical protein [Candidatus Ratteibacteria bacterium]
MRYEIIGQHWTKNTTIERVVNGKNKTDAKNKFEKNNPHFAIVQITARDSPFYISAKRVSKKWLEKYFGLNIDTNKFSSFWQTDGGKATQDFDRLNNRTHEIIHRSNSKTYWGKLK